jgi:hypothetical protein
MGFRHPPFDLLKISQFVLTDSRAASYFMISVTVMPVTNQICQSDDGIFGQY